MPDHDGRRASRSACAMDAPKTGMRVERFAPPPEIVARGGADRERTRSSTSGNRYLVDDRDGEHYFYDINALSNFVADPLNVVGFDHSSGSSTTSSRADATVLAPRARDSPRRPAIRVLASRLWRLAAQRPRRRNGCPSWDYVKRLAQRSEEIGYDITLIAELFMNDIQGIDADCAGGLVDRGRARSRHRRLELMVAVRPTFHDPATSPSRRPTSIASRGPALAECRVHLVEGRSEALRHPLR